jgi:hypothetical protein
MLYHHFQRIIYKEAPVGAILLCLKYKRKAFVTQHELTACSGYKISTRLFLETKNIIL